jgi:hypothetical protein
MEREQAVPCLGFVLWVTTARPSHGKAAAAILWGRLQALQPREGLKEDFVCLVIFSNILSAGILIAIFT